MIVRRKLWVLPLLGVFGCATAKLVGPTPAPLSVVSAKRVVLEPFNVMVLAGIIFAVCIAASGLGVRAAMKVDPATALGS